MHKLTLAKALGQLFAAVAEAPKGTTAKADEKPPAKDPEKKSDEPATPAETSGEAPKPAADPQTPPEQKPAAGDPAHGPQIPETYAFTFEEDGPYSAADAAYFSARAKALALDQTQAQTMVATEERLTREYADRLLTDLEADPELGGPKFEESVRLAEAGVEALFPADTEEGQLARAFWNRSGLGNHKAFVRAMARYGRQVSEDRGPGHAASGGSGPEEAKPEDAKYRLFPSNKPTK